MASGNLDEELSETVRKYPCLYDKSKKGHHDKNMVKNCWREVAEKIGLEDGDVAERLFTNLKKRYNKARKTADCGTGTSRKTAMSRKKKLEELNYLSWLTPYIQLRGTRTNFKAMVNSPHHSSGDMSSDESELVVKKAIDDEDGNELTKEQLSESDELQINLNSIIKDIDKGDDELLSPVSTSIASERTCGKQKYIETPTSNTKKNRKISETTGREKWHQKKERTIDDAQLSFFKTVEKSLNQPSTDSIDDPNDVFGRFIACELKQLSLREQRIAKHEMENVLFKIQMQSDCQSKQQNSQPIPAQYRSMPNQFHTLNNQNSYYSVPSNQNSSSHYNIPRSQQDTGLIHPFSIGALHQQYASSTHVQPPSCQQYTNSAQTFPASAQQYINSAHTYPVSTQQYPNSAQTVSPISKQYEGSTENFPPYSAQSNVNESEDMSHYSDETVY